MNTDLTINLLKAAGLLHFGILCAGLTMPKVIGLKQHLNTLPPFIRSLFWVYYTFIGTCLIGFGTFTYVMAEQLATADGLARAVLMFFALFWALRVVVAVFIFDVTPYLTSRMMRVGYWCTNFVFIYFTAVYAVVAWKGGAA
jgi:hypothetical protein